MTDCDFFPDDPACAVEETAVEEVVEEEEAGNNNLFGQVLFASLSLGGFMGKAWGLFLNSAEDFPGGLADTLAEDYSDSASMAHLGLMLFSYYSLVWWLAAFVGTIMTFIGMGDMALMIWHWGGFGYQVVFGLTAILTFLDWMDPEKYIWATRLWNWSAQEFTIMNLMVMVGWMDFEAAALAAVPEEAEEEPVAEEEVAAEEEAF